MALSMSMVATSSSALVSVSALQSELARNWPSMRITDVNEDESSFSMQVGDLAVAGALMPAPIPWSDLEGPSKASWLWKEAAEVLREHSNHWILTAFGAGPTLERMTLLTRLTAAFLSVCPDALGVFWTDAGHVIQPNLFRDFATELEIPLYIWVDFRVGPSKPGKSSGFTSGLQAFELMELETEDAPEKPSELLDRLSALAAYLIENGPVIRDQDTFGEDANEKIKVQYAPSAFGRDQQVMRLEYSAPKRRFFGFGKA